MELRNQLQKTLGDAYTIERELTGGGMSRVFLATEQSLGRTVVVKVLPTAMSAQVSIDRFKLEIRTAASLQQANIVPVLAAGDAGGVAYYTMPFVRGDSLRVRMAEGALSIPECIAILRDVARALAYAHGEGIVHRDIKPENILLSGHTAVVTDFGIAKAVAASATMPQAAGLTQAGMALGTPAYMAPEQALGEAIDHRADIYAFGVVAYELVTGKPPFVGKNAQALIAAHISAAPTPVQERRADAPLALARLIMRCLEKDPADRPVDARDMLDALDLPVTADVPVAEAPPNRQATIAVLPFANMSGDPDAEYFSDGMSEEILTALFRVPGLRVIARTSSFAFKGTNTDVREIGERLKAGVLVEGSVRRAADRLRITAQLIDASSGLQMWSERYDRDLKDVFAVQDEITAAILSALGEKLTGVTAVPRAKLVIDPETYDLFLRGRYLLYKPPDGIAKGIAFMEQVLERAPAYEPALAELAHAMTMAGNFGALEPLVAYPRANELARKAVELDPTDPGPHATLGHIAWQYSCDWTAARKHLDRAMELGPSHSLVANAFAYYWSSLGRYNAAVDAARRGVSLDPLNLFSRFVGISVHHFARRYRDVVSLSEELADIDPNFSEAYRYKSFALLQLGRPDDALEAAEMAVKLSKGHAYHMHFLALVHQAAGRHAEAEAIAVQFEAKAGSKCVYDLLVANLRGEFGEYDAGFAALERYHQARGHWMAMMRGDPSFDSLRADPRFEEMARRVGIPELAAHVAESGV